MKDWKEWFGKARDLNERMFGLGDGLQEDFRYQAFIARMESEGYILPKEKNKPKKAVGSLMGPKEYESFMIFWNSGMRKIGKTAAQKVFLKLITKDHHLFARHLKQDIAVRLKNEQFGFKAMHPTTYLNGERWTDEVIKNDKNTGHDNQRVNGLSAADQIAASIANRNR